MLLEERINLITNKVIATLIENHGHSPTPTSDIGATWVYHCARPADIDSIFTWGFDRYFFGKNVGNMYGPGVYATTDIGSSYNNSLRGNNIYGNYIVKARMKNYDKYLIWEPIVAKQVYGAKWRMKDQFDLLLSKYIDQMKNMNYKHSYKDGSRNLYEYLLNEKGEKRASVCAEEIWHRRDDFNNGSPFDDVKGFVFYGDNDGHVAVIKDAKIARPEYYSKDHGKTWIYAMTEDTDKNSWGTFDSQLNFGKKYDKTMPPEFGFAKVIKNGKVNYVNQSGEEISKTWFEAGGNFGQISGEDPKASVIYNGYEIYLTTDGDLWEDIGDDYPICHAREAAEYIKKH